MPTYIHQLATAVPDTAYEQQFVREVMTGWLGGDRRVEHILGRIYRHSGIERRHSVIRDFEPGAPAGAFYDPDSGSFATPGTGERNALYTREAERLFPCVARRALERSPSFSAADVSHVITVSCTGFYAPGPDVRIVRELGLAPQTPRFHLGFMGCYAAFPALKMAQAFCAADPDAVVLVVLLELCTLHLQPSRELDSLLAASVFADGAAAALVSARPPAAPALRIDGFASTLTDEGENDMAWSIGDTGFDMVLSSYIPDIIDTNLEAALAPLLASVGVGVEAIGRWAVHPGGRAILDKVERNLALAPEQIEASRWVLANYGNMSSATVMFVLERLLATGGEADERLLALAFGPGLTVESGLFTRV